MRCPLDVRWLTTCVLGLVGLFGSGASAQPPSKHPDIVIDSPVGRTAGRLARADFMQGASGTVSVTAENQILVELAAENIITSNLFDLDGRTLVFTPNGNGEYSRSVRAVAWEDDIGRAVADGEEIPLESFMLDFAGRRWGSFFVSRRGVLTLGGPFVDVDPSVRTMPEIATRVVTSTTPTISPLYKPYLGGRDDRFGATQHVAHHLDRVVVTWNTSEGDFRDGEATFQAVLHTDGHIRFNYRDVALGDGIVGLFQNEPVTRADLIVRIPDAVDDELPGHLDLREAAIYESSASSIIVEFSTRGPMPDPDAGTWYSYRLYFDAEPPYFADWPDVDMIWQVDVHPGEVRPDLGRVLPGEANRIAVDVGPVSELSGMVRAAAAEFIDNRNTREDVGEPAPIDLPEVMPPAVDLSRSDSGHSAEHSEVFHWHNIRNISTVACRVVEAFGDEFDLFVFHSEFRVDIQWAGMDWTRYGGNVGVAGIGDGCGSSA